MENKRELKVSLKTAIIIGVVLLMLFFFICTKIKKNNTKNNANTNNVIANTISTKDEDVCETENTWKGEYHQDYYFNATSKSFSIIKVVSYNDYLKYIDEINNNLVEWQSEDDKITNYYTDENLNYVILNPSNGVKIELINYIEENNKITILGEKYYGKKDYFIVIPTNMPVGTNIVYSETINYDSMPVAYKPIIYLYPEEETNITVKLGYPEALRVSYPKYENEWNVIAEPNGDLTYTKTNQKLYSLYYESDSIKEFSVQKDGFIVKGEDVAEFLEEKLAMLGLTERETEEFIIYWLPKLQENKYNYIRFATEEEIEENMPLSFSVQPDTLIRVLMTYKGLEEPIEVEEQQLETPERTGFVAVEWGGTEIK